MLVPGRAVVTSNGMVDLPLKIRTEYGLSAGSKVVFLESDSGILMMPVPPIMKLFGVERKEEGANRSNQGT